MERETVSQAPGASSPVTVSTTKRRVIFHEGKSISLEQRRSLWQILIRLVEERLYHPGSSLSVDHLLEAGWPGEVMLRKAGRARVYVAVSTLRRLGLGRLIFRRGDGYLLDPGTVISLES
jgi:hypothetical protein